MCVTVAVLPGVQGSAVVAELLVALWGFTWGAVPLVLQSWTISAVPDEPEAGSADLVTVLQGSIALGSLLGGVIISVGGLSTVFYAGAAVVGDRPTASRRATSRGIERPATVTRGRL